MHRHPRCTACPKRLPPSQAVHATLTDAGRTYDVRLCGDCFTRTAAMAPRKGVTVTRMEVEATP